MKPLDTAQHALVPPRFVCREAIDSALVALMHDSSADLDDLDLLRDRVQMQGYLYFKGFFDRRAILEGRRVVCEKLASTGALDPAFDVMDGVIAPGKRAPGFAGGVLADMFGEKSHALSDVLYTGKLMQFFRDYFAEDVRHYDFTWMRLVNPGPATQIHADTVFMGRGTKEVFTVWTPWGENDFHTGGLIVLEGSHKAPAYDEYRRIDVDAYCANTADQRDGWDKHKGGWIEDTAANIQRNAGGIWRTAHFQPGDVVIFCIDLIHGGTDNQSSNVRISTDTRYQRASADIDKRWIGERPPAHGPEGKRAMIC
jgi:Phytanoyl-CoA dioxygenase (PhyH)